MHRGLRATRLAIGLAALLLGSPAPVAAIPALQFDDAAVSGGSLSYNGAGGPLVGTGILYDTLQSNGDTAANANTTLVCSGCIASFTTGANTSEGAVNGAPWLFSANANGFLIHGSVPSLGIVDADLVQGDIATAAFVGVSALGLDFFASLALGQATVHPLIDAFFAFGNPSIMAHTDQGPLNSVDATTAAFSASNSNSDTTLARVAVPMATPFTLLVELVRWVLGALG